MLNSNEIVSLHNRSLTEFVTKFCKQNFFFQTNKKNCSFFPRTSADSLQIMSKWSKLIDKFYFFDCIFVEHFSSCLCNSLNEHFPSEKGAHSILSSQTYSKLCLFNKTASNIIELVSRENKIFFLLIFLGENDILNYY